MFCDVCQKDTHWTKDCWGQGTVSVPVQPPYYLMFVKGFKSPYPKLKGWKP